MRIRLPRPLHGWRVFAGEVGVIVLGVLVALALGAIANQIGWWLDVRAARAQIRDELSFNFELMARKERDTPCVARQLDHLGALLADASRTRQLPPHGPLERAGTIYWPRGIWESQVAAQTMVHYPATESAGLNRVYRRLEALAEADRAEQEAWNVLSMLVGPGRTLDPESEGRLYAALAQARSSNGGFPFLVRSTRDVLIQTLGADYPQSAGLRPVASRRGGCDPSGGGLVPKTYGSAAR